MITHLTVNDPGKTGVPYWSKIPALRHLGRLDLDPGLTIVWGPNGCGKSSLLRAVAHKLHCEQGGEIRVTNQSLYTDTSGTEVEHDGQLLYVAPERDVGLVGGAFDYDFLSAGTSAAMSRGSSGELVLQKLVQALNIASGDAPMPVPQHKVRPTPELAEYLSGTLPKGVPTIMLDEPDRSLDFLKQAAFFKNMPVITRGKSQVVIATHCVFALRVEGAHYVDLVPGYLERCRYAVRDIFKIPGV